jgi:hypothetical protein
LPVELTWLLLITESVIVALPAIVLMPPPFDVAVLLRTLLEATLSVAWLKMPPPSVAEFPLTVQLVSRFVPAALHRPPPVLAVLPLMVQLVRVAPPIWRPPPEGATCPAR